MVSIRLEWLLMNKNAYPPKMSGFRKGRSSIDNSQLIVSKGYPVEEHTVVTADGYVLNMQRIPRGRYEPDVLRTNNSKPTVLVVHALAVSSADFVMNFPDQSLGFLLADAGYDVWLGNLRGNEYTSHVRYKKFDRRFWRFSFDEMIQYDTPTMIDTVLRMTNSTKLLYIGFSQGTQVLFGLLADQPKYQQKAFMWICFRGSMAVRSPLSTAAAIEVCGSPYTVSICLFLVELVNGVDLYQLNVTRLPVYAAHSPSGTSVDNVYHFAQLIRCKCFRKFNHGPYLNKIVYGSVVPPSYVVSNVRVPVALYHSAGDIYAVPKDVARLEKELPNVVRSIQVPDKHMTHYDFALGMHAVDMVYNDMLELMAKYRGA
ncbi:gastric triacylglycerol lipase-like [Rhipicephalus microplus]|uniref:gastric triacylglycerol lipase-like n=1 Tax=Rhipicephalus microplus TaxID=6941 RepID=UPI003F6D5504